MTYLEKLCDTTPRVTITTKYGAAPPPVDRDWKPAHNWLVTLHRAGRQITVPFYGGDLAGEPSAADVLSSLLLDAAMGDQTFHDFCDELSYDTDSRRAEAMWKACRRTAPKLRRFLGADYDTYAEAEH